MNTETKFKIGSAWRTRGGWKATVVWHCRDGTLGVINDYAHGELFSWAYPDGTNLMKCADNDLLTPWIDRPVIKDWPKWAKAAAMDGDGQWFWYDSVPVHNLNGLGKRWWGVGDDPHSRQFHPTEIPQWTGDWRESLVVREGGE